ncbi:MAG: hypothetical protein KAG66_12115 [Methylococcales bacterium]|nr:hypothetical protein [Methylococcales bacterium]
MSWKNRHYQTLPWADNEQPASPDIEIDPQYLHPSEQLAANPDTMNKREGKDDLAKGKPSNKEINKGDKTHV